MQLQLLLLLNRQPAALALLAPAPAPIHGSATARRPFTRRACNACSIHHSPFTIHHQCPSLTRTRITSLASSSSRPWPALPQPQHANAQGRASAPRVSGRGRPGAETRGATAFASAGRTRFNRQPLATRRVLAQPAATPGPGGDSAGRWGAAAGAAAVPEQALGPRGDPTHVWPRHRLAGLAAG